MSNVITQEIVDVKDYMNKAAAIEEYSKRAKDRELENAAGRARLHCMLRMNELVNDGGVTGEGK